MAEGGSAITMETLFQLMQTQSKAMMDLSKQVQFQNDQIQHLTKGKAKVLYDDDGPDFVEDGPKLEIDLTGYDVKEIKAKKKLEWADDTTNKKDKDVANETGISQEDERYQRQVKENEKLQAQLKVLKYEVESMKIGTPTQPKSVHTLPVVPKVEFPPKFKCPTFTIFNGDSNPLTHLVIYQGELGQYEDNEALKTKLFQKSLGKTVLDWYVSSGEIKITNWIELVAVFRDQYSIFITESLERSDLERERKKPSESFKEYVARWSELAAQVYPPLDDKAKVKSLLETLEPPFYGALFHQKNLSFADFVKTGVDTEMGYARGKLKDYTLLESMAERIQTGTWTRKNDKKKEEEVALVLHGSTSVNNGKGQASPANANHQKTDQNKTGQNRVFTPLGDTYENILSILKAQGLITYFPPAPNHDPNSRSYDATKRCSYHSNAVGHSTEKCFSLKHKIQNLIEAGDVVIQAEEAPNVNKNPFPNHDTGANLVVVDDTDRGNPKPIYPIQSVETKKKADKLNHVGKMPGSKKDTI